MSQDQDQSQAPAPAEAPATPVAKPKRKWPWRLTVATIAVVAAAGGGATWPWWGQHLNIPVPWPRAAVVDDITRQVAQLSARLAAVETPPAPGTAGAPAEATLDALAARLAKLEAEKATGADKTGADKTGAEPRALTQLARQTEKLQEKSVELTTEIEQLRRSSADAGTVLRLADRVDGLDGAMRQTLQRQNNAQALLLAVGQLRDTAARGAVFAPEVKTLQLLAADLAPPAMDVLAAVSTTGAPTRAELAARFDTVANAAVTAERASNRAGWGERLLAKLASIVTVRRVDGEALGDQPDAVTARAGARLKAGDLAGAADEMTRLDGPAAEAAIAWVAGAQARLAVERALDTVSAEALARAGVQQQGR